MMKIANSFFACMIALCCLPALTSCEKELLSEQETTGKDAPSGTLSITTRADESTREVSFPVIVYVMNESGSCITSSTLNSSSDVLTFDLEPAKYDIYAIGGASSEAYTLPDASSATKDSEITLKENAVHGDLMTAKSFINLLEGESNTLVLDMTRKVFKLKTVELKDIPTTVTNVTLSIGPLHQSLLLNGSYKTGNDVQDITLTKQSDGTTWQNDAPVFLLPASSSASVSIKLTTAEGTQGITYNCPEALDANHEVSITGTYVPAAPQFITLNGIITGTTWGAPINIRFTFNEEGAQDEAGNDDNNDDNGSQGDDKPIESGTAPQKHDIYKDCYVAAVSDDATGAYTTVLLVHKNETDINASTMTEAALSAAISETLPTFNTMGIKGWRLPTEDEAKNISWTALNTRINDGRLSNGIAMGSDHHFCQGATSITSFRYVSSTTFSTWDRGTKLRPVTTLKFNKQ